MCDSFREYMAPNELKGRRLVGPDQAMMQAQDRVYERRDEMGCGPVLFVEASRHDHKAMHRFGKRLERGGSMFKAGHIIG